MFLHFLELISAVIIGLQWISCSTVCSLGGGKSRLIWLIFHKAYKGRGHSRLFRLFVLGQYYTARLSCCAVVLQSPHSTRAQCQDKALDAKSVYLRLRCLWNGSRLDPLLLFYFAVIRFKGGGRFALGIVSLSWVLITANRFVLMSSPVLFDISWFIWNLRSATHANHG